MTIETQGRTDSLAAEVAAEIRAMMGRRLVRQSELARRLGENDQWVSTRLRGVTPLNLNDLQRVAEALGVAPGDLLPTSARAGSTTRGGDPDAGGAGSRAIMTPSLRRDERHMLTATRPKDNRPAPRATRTGRPLPTGPVSPRHA